jgi:calcium-independent phospholipase A2
MPRHAIAIENSPGDKILYILHAVGAPRCPPDHPGCNLGCRHNETFNGTMPPQPLGPVARDFLNNLLDVATIPPKVDKSKVSSSTIEFFN